MDIGYTMEPSPPPKRRSPSGAAAATERPRASIAPAPRLDDERAYLYEIIQTIGSGPDLDMILSGVVRLVTEATQCHACLIWFREGERLVLRVSSSPYAHLADAISMGAGEGLAGWVTKTRHSAFIKENALEDPRVKYFPELEEEDFQSLVSVPMFGRDADVMGVISLHAEAPHEFGRADLDFLEHTASLMAGAVENARLYEDSTERVALLTNLSRLSQRVAAAGGIEEVLTTVSTGTRELLGASRCEIYLADPDEELNLAAADPPRSGGPSLDGRLWLGGDDRDPPGHGALAEALWGKDPGGTPMLAPLTAGDQRLGLLAILQTHSPPGVEMTLAAVAAHAAVAIRQHQLVERLLEKNLVKDFFAALSGRDASATLVAALAGRLGCDLDARHVLMHVAPWTGVPPMTPSAGGAEDRSDPPIPWLDIAGQVEVQLAGQFPGALFDRADRSVRALIPMPTGELDRLVEEIRSTVADVAQSDRETVPLSIGVSNVCRGADFYPGGFDEAIAAAEVGGLLRAGPGVTSYEELGAYKYVLGSPGVVGDRDQERLYRLVAYDRRRSTQLLDTLERFLDDRGNVAGAARALYIHPNTLRQRLERIERETGIDLDRDDWLSLAVAVKVVKLRLMRASISEGRESDV